MNFKRNCFKYFSFLIVTLTMLFLFGGRTTNAETTKTVDTITNLEIKNDKGGEIDGKIGKWDRFRVAGEFALEGKGVTAGDTTVIKLDDPIIISSSDFELKDAASDQTVATAHVDKATGTITLTYTSFVDTHSNVSGNFFFYAQVDSAKQKNSGDVPVKVSVDGKTKFTGKVSYDGVGDTNNYVIKKTSWVSSDNKTIHYIVPVNRTSQALNNVKILDELKYQAAKYLKGSFEIWKGEWKYTNGSWKLENKTNVTAQYTKNIKDGSFEITLGNMAADDHFEIRYDVQLDYEPADGELLLNTVSLQSNDKVIQASNANTKIQIAGGSGVGYVFAINIHKTDGKGKALKGAKFQVIREATKQVVGEYVTDENGNITVTGLLKTKYIIKEIEAPEGYVIDVAETIVDPSEFDGSSNAATKEVVNNPTTTTEAPTTTTEAPTTEAGQELPNTGTANSFLAVIGGLLVVVGSAVLVSRKKA